ncbi:MAG: D-Ala-D-Ala carboxypeptidase family metallohydrolase [Oscillospiraceae bacterium]|nr:D-Ala-D-Ala carboxypeptidase family metallohydrolase [Oscillospiraceae bacterium]
MMIRIFSLRRDGNVRLTTNFNLNEFRSRCGADEVRVDMNAVEMLQKIRTQIGKPVIITSAFRTATHNRNIGGASNSLHLEGRAFDIRTNNPNDLVVLARLSETAEFNGIYISVHQGYVHMDTRSTKWFARKNPDGTYTNVSTFGGNVDRFNLTRLLRLLSPLQRGNDVTQLQRELNRHGIRDRNGRVLIEDSIFGPLTDSAVRNFQRVKGLVVDGIVGPNTSRALNWLWNGR